MKYIKILGCCAVLTVFFAFNAHASENFVNKLQFCELIIQTLIDRGTITDFTPSASPFGDTDNKYARMAYELGFVAGDGAGNFYPDQLITRDDAAVVIKRVQDYITPRLIYDNTRQNYVYDTNHAESYAVGPIKCLSMTDTIDGGNFYPKGGVTRDFVWSTLFRAYRTTSMPVSHPGYLSTRQLPVLMYHLIAPVPFENHPYPYLFVSADQFDAQIKYLCEQGYTFLFPDEMYYADHIEKAVVITFDDGYADNYFFAYETLKKYGAKATIFVAGINIDQPGGLSKAQIREMAQSGLVNIGSHTLNHHALTNLDTAALQEEMAGSQWLLEQITGKKITNLAYPFGKYNSTVADMAKRYYSIAFSVTHGNPMDSFAIPRITIPGSMDLSLFSGYLPGVQSPAETLHDET